MKIIKFLSQSIIVGMDNNNTIETNMILTDDIEISKLIYEYIVRE